MVTLGYVRYKILYYLCEGGISKKIKKRMWMERRRGREGRRRGGEGREGKGGKKGEMVEGGCMA